MRKLFLVFIFISILFPFSVFADCSNNGATVVYINGIFTTENAAKSELRVLEYDYAKKVGGSVSFLNGYNATHLGGLDDLVSSVEQAYGGAGMDYDLASILRQVHGELSTRKVLLVGYSQGTFYSNAAYDYLVSHGVPKESIAVYNIATPADRVAGGGSYLTSTTDKVINYIVRQLTDDGYARKPLPANITIPLTAAAEHDSVGGHSLVNDYLHGASGKIIGDIQQGISGLSVDKPVGNDCFSAPSTGIAYQIQGVGFSIGDHIAGGMSYSYRQAASAASFVMNTAKYGLAQAANQVQLAVSSVFSLFGTGALSNAVAVNSPKPIGMIEPDYQTHSQPMKPIEPDRHQQALVLQDNQNVADDVFEEVDLLNRQVADEARAPVAAVPTPSAPVPSPTPVPWHAELAYDSTTPYTGPSSGIAKKTYSKLLISEVQISGQADEKEEFVELYNPGDLAVDLTGWYLQRKTKIGSSWSSYASNTLFEGKIIPAKGYFLIARQGYFDSLADVFTPDSLSEDNSLALKNPNGDAVDLVGWGQAQDFEGMPAPNPSPGQSIGRKLDETDTDNNAADFEVDSPTPKSANEAYVAPIPTPTSTPTSTPTPTPTPMPLANILIYQVETFGKDANDQFVELYNPNEAAIDLAGFALKKKTSTGTESNLVAPAAFSGSINGHGFFQIVPQNYSGAGAADLTYSGKTLALAQKDNTVLLYDAGGNLLDAVGFGNAADAETAPFACLGESQCIPKGKSIERKTAGTDTDNNADDFTLLDAPDPKMLPPAATIADSSNYQTSLDFSLGEPVYNLLINWSSSSSNAASYEVQESANGDDWADWAGGEASKQKSFRVPYPLFDDAENTYQFRVRAKDTHGNAGSWSAPVIVSAAVPVVINEVALSGTNASANDQWVELYNKSNADVDVAGWTLNGDSFSIPLQGTIPAGGYFLLERGDGGAIANITPSQTFSDAIGGSRFILRDSRGRYIDELFENVNPAAFVSNGNPCSAERVSTNSFGNAVQNWLPSSERGRAIDRNGNPVCGTPGTQNSVAGKYTYAAFNIVSDRTLPASLSPYLFKGGVEVASNAMLSIEPGSVLQFYDSESSFNVRGALKSEGTQDNPIVFTSLHDSGYGGTSSGGGNDWWQGVDLLPGSSSVLKNTIIRYGGANTDGAALWAQDGSAVSVNDSIFERNKNRSLKIDNAQAIIDGVTFSHNDTTDWEPGQTFFYEEKTAAISVSSGSPIIKDCAFAYNLGGIYVANASPTISDNQFDGNSYPVYLATGADARLSGDEAPEDARITFAADITKDLDLQADLPYWIRGIVTVPKDVTFTLEPGVTLDFQDSSAGLLVNGTLKAVGTADKPIVFEPANQGNEQLGVWQGLDFSSTSSGSDLENTSVLYGGTIAGGGIDADQSAITLKDSIIQGNMGSGVRLVNSASQVDNVQFLDQTTPPPASPQWDRGLDIEGGSPSISNSYFSGNDFGMYLADWRDANGNTISATPALNNNQFSNNRVADMYPIPSPD